MKARGNWRFILEIVGAILAVAGLICMLIAFWDKLSEGYAALTEKFKSKRRVGRSDFADEMMYE